MLIQWIRWGGLSKKKRLHYFIRSNFWSVDWHFLVGFFFFKKLSFADQENHLYSLFFLFFVLISSLCMCPLLSGWKKWPKHKQNKSNRISSIHFWLPVHVSCPGWKKSAVTQTEISRLTCSHFLFLERTCCVIFEKKSDIESFVLWTLLCLSCCERYRRYHLELWLFRASLKVFLKSTL